MIRILRNNGWEYLSNVLYEISLVVISAVIFKYTNHLIIRIYFLKKQFSPIRILSVTWISFTWY